MGMEPLHEMMDIIKRAKEEEKKCRAICDDIYNRWKDCVNLAEDRILDIFSHLRPFVKRRVSIRIPKESRSYLFVSRDHIYVGYRSSDIAPKYRSILLSHFIHAISNYSDEIISVIRPKIRDDFASLVPKAKKILEIKSRVSVPSVIRKGDFIIPDLDEVKIIRICEIKILGGDPCTIHCTRASSEGRSIDIEIWRASKLFHLYPTIYEMLLELRDKVYAETEEIAKTFKEIEDIISPYFLKRKIVGDDEES